MGKISQPEWQEDTYTPSAQLGPKKQHSRQKRGDPPDPEEKEGGKGGEEETQMSLPSPVTHRFSQDLWLEPVQGPGARGSRPILPQGVGEAMVGRTRGGRGLGRQLRLKLPGLRRRPRHFEAV